MMLRPHKGSSVTLGVLDAEVVDVASTPQGFVCNTLEHPDGTAPDLLRPHKGSSVTWFIRGHLKVGYGFDPTRVRL